MYEKGYKIIIIKYWRVFIMRRKVNKVSVEKGVGKRKGNSLIGLEVLKRVKEKKGGVLKSCLGRKREI